MYFEITEKERDYLLRVMDHFVTTNSHLHQEVIAEIMMMYWRLHRSKSESAANDS
tara:strand:- start:47 stop:211 length:165 start_codon:yes stop_codon:yes gene_type:complete